MNAETSAWGRAIIAVGASDAKRVASANEVRNRQQPDPMVEVEQLLVKADGLVDADKVREYAQKGPGEAAASVVKLRGLLEQAG
jgi:hypothetical protein